jgi:membrane fusion protein (multidrug efflux system)
MDKLPPIPSPPGTAFREFRIKFVPGLAFVAVLASTVYLWHGYVGPSPLVGEVQTVRSVVSAPVSGQLTQLPVVQFQRVTAGQIVGQISPAEPALLDAQVALAKARIDQVRVNYEPALRKQNNDVSYAGLRMNWLEARTQLAAVLARTNYLGGELDRAKRFEKGLGSDGVVPRSADPVAGFASLADVQKAQGALDEAVASIAERQKAIAEIQALLERIQPEEQKLDDEIPAGVRAAIAVEERNLQLLETQLAPRPVLAPIDGVVTLLQHRAGEHVQSGDVLLTITAETPKTIVAYFRQPLAKDTRVGQAVEVRVRGGNRLAATVKITDVGPAMETIPGQMLPPKMNGAPAEMGLPVLLAAPSGLGLHPGELVDLRMQD